MRARTYRHLPSVLPELFQEAPPTVPALLSAGTLAEPSGGGQRERPVLPPEFSWRDYSIALVDIAAEIEHALMVQYLFAAYSLGGPQVPSRLANTVRRWQEVILGIAKEEMGHLITMQNVLTALGAPVHLDREDYPWGSEFYPFPFTLRPLSLGSLATYVCAESPSSWSGDEAEKIKKCASQTAGQRVNRVGALFERVDAVLGDRSLVPDSAFQERTLPYQASWDEWGRGYTRGQRGRESGEVNKVQSPDLLIFTVFSRDSARKALHEIGEQGEAAGPVDPETKDETSHFRRFLSVYRELEKLPEADRALVARPVADNPVTVHRLNDWASTTSGAEATAPVTHHITHHRAVLWAHLFNVRYRMLLVDVSHALRLAGPLDNGQTLTARGTVIHHAFAEMYNLRAIAGRLVTFPLREEGGDLCAGPPFEMPYTLQLPDGEHDRWLVHQDLVLAAQLITEELLKLPNGADPYLSALQESDELALKQIQRILKAER